MVVLEQLGGPAERVTESTPRSGGERAADPLHCVAFECRAQAGVPPGCSRSPGLPDDAYEHDGQLTKRAVRAVTLAALEPAPGLAALGRRRRQRLDRHRVAASRAGRARRRRRGACRARAARSRNALALGVPEPR